MNRRCASRLPPPAATLWATSESVGCWPALIWYIYTDLECAQSRRAPHAATSPEERDNASTPKMTPSPPAQRHGDGVTPPGRAHTHRDTRGRASVCEPSRLRAGVSGVAVCPVTPCACPAVCDMWLCVWPFAFCQRLVTISGVRAKGYSRHDEREALPHPVLGRVMHGHNGNALRQRLRQDRRLARRESDRRDDVDVAGRCLGRVPGGR